MQTGVTGLSGRDINLDLEQLKSEVITLNDRKLKEIDRIMKSANTIVSRLARSGWEGDSAKAFLEKFAEYKKDTGLFCEHLNEFNKQLKRIHSSGKQLRAQSRKVTAKL